MNQSYATQRTWNLLAADIWAMRDNSTWLISEKHGYGKTDLATPDNDIKWWTRPGHFPKPVNAARSFQRNLELAIGPLDIMKSRECYTQYKSCEHSARMEPKSRWIHAQEKRRVVPLPTKCSFGIGWSLFESFRKYRFRSWSQNCSQPIGITVINRHIQLESSKTSKSPEIALNLLVIKRYSQTSLRASIDAWIALHQTVHATSLVICVAFEAAK